jgi:hypothetical protein
MNREDIIRMAQEAGLHRQQHNLMSNPVQHRFSYDGYEENLERFADLVASAEREACAKVCEDHAGIIDAPSAFIDGPSNNAKRKALDFADAIRARGQA